MSFIPANTLDAAFIGQHLREADRLELDALGIPSASAAVISLDRSDFASTWVPFRAPVAMCGLVIETTSTLGPRVGQVWALTTPSVDRYRKAFWRDSKRWIAEAAQHVDVMWQHVDARYLSCLRWLTRLGFRIHPARPHGTAGLPFHLVTRES